MSTSPFTPDLEKTQVDVPLIPKKKIRTIDNLWTFMVATAVLGPFALPLLWRNPRFKWSTKIGGSLVVLAITWFLLKFSADFLGSQGEQIQQLLELKQQLQQQAN